MRRLLGGLCRFLTMIAARRAIRGRIQLRMEVVTPSSLLEDAAPVTHGKEYGTHH